MSGHRSETMIRRIRSASDSGRSRRHPGPAPVEGVAVSAEGSLLMASSRWTRTTSRPGQPRGRRPDGPPQRGRPRRRRSCRARAGDPPPERAPPARRSPHGLDRPRPDGEVRAAAEARRVPARGPPVLRARARPGLGRRGEAPARQQAVARQLARLRGGPLLPEPARVLPLRGGRAGPLRDGEARRSTPVHLPAGLRDRRSSRTTSWTRAGFQVLEDYTRAGSSTSRFSRTSTPGRLDGRARGDARAHERRGSPPASRPAWRKRPGSAPAEEVPVGARVPGRPEGALPARVDPLHAPEPRQAAPPAGRGARTRATRRTGRPTSATTCGSTGPPTGRAAPGQPPDQPGAAGDGAPHLRLHDPARSRALGLPDPAAGEGRLPPPLEGGRARHGHPRGPHDRRLGRGEGAARHHPRPPGLSLRRRQAHDERPHGLHARLPAPPAGGAAPAPPRPPDHRPAEPDGPPLPRDDPAGRGLRGLAEAAAPPRLRGDHPRPAPVLPGPEPGRGHRPRGRGRPAVGPPPLLRGDHRELARPVPPPALRGLGRLRLGAPPRRDPADREGAHALAKPPLQQPRLRRRSCCSWRWACSWRGRSSSVLPASVLAAKWSLAKGLGLGAVGSGAALLAVDDAGSCRACSRSGPTRGRRPAPPRDPALQGRR